MNNILEMIKNEKVEWKKLGEIAVVSGAGVDKKIKEHEKVIKLLNYMDVYKNLYINSDIPQMKVTASDKKIKDCDIKYGDIFITPSSETKEDIFMSSVAIENFQKTVYSYHIMRIRLKEKNFITSCFLNYIFRSIEFRKKMQKKVFGNTRQTITKTEIEKLEVPIPSIKIQEKIVDKLDKFKKYIDALQNELQNRSRSYEYFRDLVLSEDYLNKFIKKCNTESQISYFKLKELVDFIVGGDVPKNQFSKIKTENYKIPIYSNGTEENSLYGYTNIARVLERSITISARGTIGYVSLKEEPYYPIVRLICLIPKSDKLNLDYLYYYLQQYKFSYVKTGIPSLTRDMISNIKLPLPNIYIQNKVVEVLDKFQNLISNAEGLLPEEIEQRQKQYEYYREKLLTFENNMVQIKSSQVVLSRCYFEILREACEIVDVDLFDIKFKTLGEIAKEKLEYGSGTSAVEYNDKVRYIRITDIDDFGNLKSEKVSPSKIEEKYYLDYGDILFARSGATVGKNFIYKDNQKAIFAGYLIRLKVNEKGANPEYVYNCLNTTSYKNFIFRKKGVSSKPNINAKQYSEFKIPVPPLPVQEQVVKILDKFDILINDINVGLPKEIELRQKQYEYYREKLLDFSNKEIG